MNDGKSNKEELDLPRMRKEFQAAIARLTEAAEPTEKVFACVEALVRHVGKLGIIDIDTGYAQWDFQLALAGGLTGACMDRWDELLHDIRYPVACCHIVTGTLPGGFLSNTVAVISSYNRNGKPLGHEVVEWAALASTGMTDKESYAGFNKAIREAAVRLGAGSLFKFLGGDLSSSVSIAHDPDLGPCWLHERSYRREPESRDGQVAATAAVGETGIKTS